MYTDKRERVEFVAESSVIDQIIDWFGFDIRIQDIGENKVKVSLKASPNAMFHWAMQYIEVVEIKAPEHLRERIKSTLNFAQNKYN